MLLLNKRFKVYQKKSFLVLQDIILLSRPEIQSTTKGIPIHGNIVCNYTSSIIFTTEIIFIILMTDNLLLFPGDKKVHLIKFRQRIKYYKPN